SCPLAPGLVPWLLDWLLLEGRGRLPVVALDEQAEDVGADRVRDRPDAAVAEGERAGVRVVAAEGHVVGGPAVGEGEAGAARAGVAHRVVPVVDRAVPRPGAELPL